MKPELFDSIRGVTSGAAPLGAEDEERFIKKVNRPIQITQGKSSVNKQQPHLSYIFYNYKIIACNYLFDIVSVKLLITETLCFHPTFVI